MPVRIEHDAVCGLVGETVLGAARGFDNVIYLTVSTGISVGILIDGAVLNGAHGVAGELGHTPVERHRGFRAPAGRGGASRRTHPGGRSPSWAARPRPTEPARPSPPFSGPGRDHRQGPARRGAAGRPGERRDRRQRVQLLTVSDPAAADDARSACARARRRRDVQPVLRRPDRRAAAQLPGGNAARVRMAQLGASSVMYGGMVFLGQCR